MKWTPERRMALLALVVLALDQATKWAVIGRLPMGRELMVVPGFFKLVHWGNTGAAWSLFLGNNSMLAAISLVALIVLYLARRHFDGDTVSGQVALGLIFGGIAGNLTDRLVHRHVVDFLYFHLIRRDGRELGFPAFNLADTAICVGVGLILIATWVVRPDRDGPTGHPASTEQPPKPSPRPVAQDAVQGPVNE